MRHEEHGVRQDADSLLIDTDGIPTSMQPLHIVAHTQIMDRIVAIACVYGLASIHSNISSLIEKDDIRNLVRCFVNVLMNDQATCYHRGNDTMFFYRIES